MTTDDLSTARLDMPVAEVMAGIARVVPASEIVPVLNEMHDRLAACASDEDHVVQVHEFLDIDQDIATRDYPPMRGRKAIPGLYPNTSSATNYHASVAANLVTPVRWDDTDCEPVFAPKPTTDVPMGEVL